MRLIPAKTIISGYSDNSSWFGTNYNMNIYKGCCHGCIYCDSRSECYHVENFDEVRAKENALAIIERELKSKKRTGVVGTGAMSDPYNPFEKKYCLTRGALSLINTYGFGSSIATKSDLVTRDIDILKEIRRHSPVLIKLTITTCDDALSKRVEPNVTVSSKRFAALSELADSGIFAGILLMPVLPFIEDNEDNIIGIVRNAAESGARFIYAAFGMTLRQNQRDWYYNKLDEQFPGIRQRYEKQYGNSYSCHSPEAEKLWKLFSSECDKYGILYRMEDIIKAYKQDYGVKQLSIFDLG